MLKEDGYGDFGEAIRIRPRLYTVVGSQRLMIYKSKSSFYEHSSIHTIVHDFRKEYRRYLRDEKINMRIKNNGITI